MNGSSLLTLPYVLFRQVAKAHCRVPVGDGAREKGQGEVVVDVDAIVNDFQLLGEGLVKEVQVLK